MLVGRIVAFVLSSCDLILRFVCTAVNKAVCYNPLANAAILLVSQQVSGCPRSRSCLRTIRWIGSAAYPRQAAVNVAAIPHTWSFFCARYAKPPNPISVCRKTCSPVQGTSTLRIPSTFLQQQHQGRSHHHPYDKQIESSVDVVVLDDRDFISQSPICWERMCPWGTLGPESQDKLLVCSQAKLQNWSAPEVRWDAALCRSSWVQGLKKVAAATLANCTLNGRKLSNSSQSLPPALNFCSHTPPATLRRRWRACDVRKVR